ncbi:MAG: tRNA pseudouridine(55) synthase TruB [Pyrinomonadaceae bacterium]
MDGLLVIDKPAGITSHDVVNRVRRVLGIKRVGHTGTLDPFATGVMVVIVGRATRLAQFLDKDQKEYTATVRFGFETDTGDATGTRKSDTGVPNKDAATRLASVDWDELLSSFRGEIDQLPPMYSAKKIGGKKLYESARKGIDVERKPQHVTIYELRANTGTLHHNLQLGTSDLELIVTCSAGTYVRVLAEDIGRAMGVGAHLAELRRTRSGRFDLSQTVTLDQLAQLDHASKALLPMEKAVDHLPEFVLHPDRVEKTRNGMSTRLADTPFADAELVRMTSPGGELIAIGTYSADDGSVRPKVVLV